MVVVGSQRGGAPSQLGCIQVVAAVVMHSIHPKVMRGILHVVGRTWAIALVWVGCAVGIEAGSCGKLLLGRAMRRPQGALSAE